METDLWQDLVKEAIELGELVATICPSNSEQMASGSESMNDFQHEPETPRFVSMSREDYGSFSDNARVCSSFA